MLKIRPIVAVFVLLSGAIISSVHAQTASYDTNTRILTVPSIQVGSTVYPNLSFRVDSGAVLSVGPGMAADAVAQTCTDANLTLDSYNAVAVGMTVAQVNAVFGCPFTPRLISRSQTETSYGWQSFTGLRNVSIFFDATGTTVTPSAGTGLFKLANGF